MLKYIEGDIFNSPAQVLVNTVNTVGVMGKGIALQFKKLYPDMFSIYRKACDKHLLVIGKLMLWYGPDHWVLMFPTKEHWRNSSRLDYIEKGLMAFVRKYTDFNITSIAFPKLGCGNGELNWNDVKPLMEKYLKDLPIDVYIYIGVNQDLVPEHKIPHEMNEWLKEHAKDMSFTGVKDSIIYNSAIAPVEFIYNNEKWEAQYDFKKNQLVFTNNAENVISVNDDDFEILWNEIQDNGVFTYAEDEWRNLIYSLLSSEGYLSIVKVQDEETSDMLDGFQYNAGPGRYFLVKG